jgi:hypothetical protein
MGREVRGETRVPGAGPVRIWDRFSEFVFLDARWTRVFREAPRHRQAEQKSGSPSCLIHTEYLVGNAELTDTAETELYTELAG